MSTTTKINPFEAVAINGLSLQNRLVMAPMTRSRALGHLPNEVMAAYYGQRASAGLIITEGVSPSPNGLGYARIPGIFNEAQIAGWKKVTDAVHEKGGKIFVQLMHTGRVSHPANMPEDAVVLGPSAIPVEGEIWTDALGMQPYAVPRSMSAEEIAQTVAEHAQAAKNALAAGFDGAEIHGANGYLAEQFTNPHVNTREDKYGGSVHNRLRFLLEVVDAVTKAIGADHVGVRVSPYSTFNSMPAYAETAETYKALTHEINRRKLLYIHLIESSARNSDEGRELLSYIREKFVGIMIVNGAYARDTVENVLDAGRADLVSLGVPFISNPDLVQRLRDNLPLNAPQPETFYSPEEKGYTDYPFYDN
ncbi:MAG TPA: alkene reductase [Cyclobacteriaceae bacterium]|nr:alkene reductase [Cyclobacteriaceae bacterium]